MASLFRCPSCKERLLQRCPEGIKLRSAIMIFKSGDVAVVKCPKCKKDVEISAHLGEELQKALDRPPVRPVIRRGLRLRNIVDSEDSAQ